jgi:hypothetical protein
MIKAGTTLPKYEKGKVPADFSGQYLEVEYKEGDGKVLEIIKSTPRVATATKQPTTATPQQTTPKTTAPKQETKGKTVSLSTIKSKIGTAGFEGYTEKELVDYYKSQGYTIQ